jgi:UDP-N-acetylmuramoyl-tripeptide--D-alanyl-D-alanine ligase
MNLTLGEIAALVGSSCGAPQKEVCGYSIDSRTLGPGQLFFAIRGPRFDGHQFIAQALERGAAGAVVEQGFHAPAGEEIPPLLIPVPDTVAALQALARAVRRKWGRKLVAVTGSTGKSTTKEMIATLLARRLRVLKSPGNLNNDYGLPLALLALAPKHDVAVMELAMSAAGEIARLAGIAEPDIGVITNVAPVHLQFFESVDSIARAKQELVDYLAIRGAQGIAVLNQDDPRVKKFARGFPGRVLTFGFTEGADLRALQVGPGERNGTEVRVSAPSYEEKFLIPLPGQHNVHNALAALAAASLFDLSTNDLREALAGFRNLHQRSEILTLPGGITVVNDCYNSNPLAMEHMLATLAAWPGAERRIVVAGEMLELGRTSPELHREVGRRCAESGLSWLVAVQGDARSFLEGAAAAGMPGERMRFFPDAGQAGEFVQGLLRPGDVILVKGSRAVHLETAIELLRSRLEVTVAAYRPGSEPKS